MNVPFIIVVTKAISNDGFDNEIRSLNREAGIGEIKVIRILAQDYPTSLGTIPAFGLKKLVNETLGRLPEFIRASFIAAQKIDIALKRTECAKVINKYAKLARAGFWDKVPIVNIFTSDEKIRNMLKEISWLYNMTWLSNRRNIFKFLIRTKELWEYNLFSLLLLRDKKYSKRYKEILDKISKMDELDVNKFKYDDKDRVAQMMVLFGYVFLEAVERVWGEVTEEELKDVTLLIKKLEEKTNEIFEK
jgi:hypothetical protein